MKLPAEIVETHAREITRIFYMQFAMFQVCFSRSVMIDQ